MKPSEMYPAGTLIGGMTLTQSDAIYEEEKKTHRHLERGEKAKVGDMYGGKDMGFLYEVTKRGDKGTNMRPGDLVDWAICYRIRRPL